MKFGRAPGTAARRWVSMLAAISCGVLAGCGGAPQLQIPAATFAQAVATPPHIAPPPTDVSSAIPGEMIVKFKNPQDSEVPGAREIGDVAGIAGAHVYKLESGVYDTQAVSSLADDPRIAYAEPRYVYHIADGQLLGQQDVPPGATMLDQLWGIFKIDALAAWAEATGSPDVIVADVDTGIDYTHPDLASCVIKGPNLVDGTTDPMDDEGHGTHTAGTLAADGKVLGVAFGVKVLAIKVLDSSGTGAEDTIAQGIDDAVKDGAKIINLSLGGPSDSYTLRDAIANATAKGVLCVVAAGNDGSTAPSYPAADPGALAVGAVDTGDQRASFSNYGPYVQIAAPGVNILSTYLGGGYEVMSGTSMATPHVAGAAALLLSKYPGLSVSQLEQALTRSGDPVTGFDGNPWIRRLNLDKALQLAATLSVEPQASTDLTPLPLNLPTDVPFDLPDVRVASRSTHGATIAWTTLVPTKGFIAYGSDGQYGSTIAESAFSTDHQLTISGLSRWRPYHYQVYATDAAGQKYASGDRTFWTKLWWLFSLSQAPRTGN